MAPIETELKLRLVNPDDLSILLNHPSLRELAQGETPVIQHLETTYYDTPSYNLLHNQLSFRLRHEENRWIATVKADGGGDGGFHQREEYNISYPEPVPIIDPFITTPIGMRLTTALGSEALQPIFTTAFDRHLLQLTCPDATQIELALDYGKILAAGKEQALAEVELELKHGVQRHLLGLGAKLARVIPLLPEANSKWDRGAALAGLPLPAHKSTAKALNTKKKSALSQDARMTLSQLCIRQIHQVIAAQQSFFDNPALPKTLHDLRISLRRLRAFLSFCKPLLPGDSYPMTQEALRSWGKVTETLREIDVLTEDWHQLNSCRVPSPTKGQSLEKTLEDTRLAEVAAVVCGLSAGQYTPLLLDLWDQAENWSAMETVPAPPLADYIDQRLTHWLQDILQAGAQWDFSDPQALHQLRIRGKKLRYVLEILTVVMENRHSRLLGSRLKRLQDHLGIMHDSFTSPPLLARLVKPSSARLLHYDSGLIVGWQSAQYAVSQGKLHKSWRKLKKSANAWIHRHDQRLPAE